jgi:hypothetical protein
LVHKETLCIVRVLVTEGSKRRYIKYMRRFDIKVKEDDNLEDLEEYMKYAKIQFKESCMHVLHSERSLNFVSMRVLNLLIINYIFKVSQLRGKLARYSCIQFLR